MFPEEEAPDVDDIFVEIDEAEAEDKMKMYRQYAANMNSAQLWWLAHHIDAEIEKRRVDVGTIIQTAVNVCTSLVPATCLST